MQRVLEEGVTALAVSPRKLGWAMREQRLFAGLSVFELAHRMGPSYTADRIAQWERGNRWPTVKGLAEYARACGVTLREVLP